MMMATAVKWLPAGDGEQAALQRLVNTTVAAWQARWFAEADYKVTGMSPVSPRDIIAMRTPDWQRVAAGLIIQSTRITHDQLVCAALGLDEVASLNSETDRKLLDDLYAQIISDLKHSLASLCGVKTPESASAPSGFDAAGGVRFQLAGQNSTIIADIFIGNAALSTMINRPSAPPRGKVGLTARTAAVAPASITLDVNLGQATLSLSDLKQLAPGDVLVLDSLVKHGVHFAMARQKRAIAHGILCQDQQNFAVQLQATTSQFPSVKSALA